ncbi:MAG: metallophosphoesterase [Phycisphaerae bacterium]|nr:metallophosphoesterase [Phycisphaerae bacterium]
MKHGYVISDLHMFAHRSSAYKHFDEIEEAASRGDFLVFNGDIFDFRWSTLSGLAETLDAAIDWLKRLANKFPKCKIFYVLGNHDCLEQLAGRLDCLANETPNFQWLPSHLRVSNVLFFHGDLVLDRDVADPFSRELLKEDKQKGHFPNLIYRMIVSLRLHQLTVVFHWPQYCARKILRALEAHGQGLGDGLTDVYFGHTHGAFSDYDYQGVTFHNTGATVRGIEANMLEVRT